MTRWSVSPLTLFHMDWAGPVSCTSRCPETVHHLAKPGSDSHLWHGLDASLSCSNTHKPTRRIQVSMTVGASLRPEAVLRLGVRPPSAEALSSWKVVRLPSPLKRFSSDMLACRGAAQTSGEPLTCVFLGDRTATAAGQWALLHPSGSAQVGWAALLQEGHLSAPSPGSTTGSVLGLARLGAPSMRIWQNQCTGVRKLGADQTWCSAHLLHRERLHTWLYSPG